VGKLSSLLSKNATIVAADIRYFIFEAFIPILRFITVGTSQYVASADTGCIKPEQSRSLVWYKLLMT